MVAAVNINIFYIQCLNKNGKNIKSLNKRKAQRLRANDERGWASISVVVTKRSAADWRDHPEVE